MLRRNRTRARMLTTAALVLLAAGGCSRDLSTASPVADDPWAPREASDPALVASDEGPLPASAIEPPGGPPPVPDPVELPPAGLRTEAALDPPADDLFADQPLRLPGGKELVRVYYGTNRQRSDAADGLRDPDHFYTGERGPLDFGVLEVSVPGRHTSGEIERPRWYRFEREDAARHVVLQRLVPVDESVLVRELRADIARDPTRQAFVFVHGFNVSFAEAAWRTGQMKADLEFAGPAVMYSWPSLGLPDPVSYGRDQRRARKSRRELMRFLQTVATRCGADRVHVIAHSMGNEVVVPALAAIRQDPSRTRPLFEELVLAAPDIDAEIFRDDIAGKLNNAATRTTVYAADHDAALLASVALNRTPRLGLARGLVMADCDHPHLDLVDASPVAFRLFELGHSDYGGPLLNDVRATLAGVPTSGRRLAKHRRIARGWTVIGGGGLREVVPAPPRPKPAAEPTLWARVSGWWPF